MQVLKTHKLREQSLDIHKNSAKSKLNLKNNFLFEFWIHTLLLIGRHVKNAIIKKFMYGSIMSKHINNQKKCRPFKLFIFVSKKIKLNN
jgi:hypothetical protein